MKTFKLSVFEVPILGVVLLTGCASDPNRVALTNPRQPGPAIGRGVGVVAGSVTGNVAGAVVGTGEGFVQGVSAPFDNQTRIVRRWHTEKTPDGRTIQVPEDIVVDAQGRPIQPAQK
ncbi:MAG: flagellar motor protein MotB [Verrucomicrobiota bacterium]